MAQHLVQHPEFVKTGVRLIMRVWRNKDAPPDGRRCGKTLVSTSPHAWQEAVEQLLADAIPGERVYASAEPRSWKRAVRLFKERQLAADYEPEEQMYRFYSHVENQWLSALGNPVCSARKLFLFDCDDSEAHQAVLDALATRVEGILHDYPTKAGRHVLTVPFDPAGLPLQPHRNGLLLAGWVQ